MECRAFQQYLYDHIPLSAAMSARVLEAGPDGVLLEAPLAPNVNHRDTAFGGSVSALAILAGWGLVHLRLRDEGVRCHIVIQNSAVAYLEPVDAPFQARTTPPDAGAWQRFRRSLERWGRGRIPVHVDVTSQGVGVATLDGDYVALSRS